MPSTSIRTAISPRSSFTQATSTPTAWSCSGVFKQDVFTFVEDLWEEPEAVITLKRMMLRAEQIPGNKNAIFSHAELQKKNYRGQRWPYDFKADLQSLSLEPRLPNLREAIDAEVDRAQLE